MTIPTLTTKRLTLRPFAPEDTEPLFHILQGKDALRYFPNATPPPLERVENLIARQLEHWDAHGYGWWAVERQSQTGLIGWSGLQFLPETSETEIGYLLGLDHWGQGYATEAAQAGVTYGFETLGLERIIGLAHPENLASRRVLEKLGMTLLGQAEYFGMTLCRYAAEAREASKG